MTVRILQGDCLEIMRGMPAESVDCCVTSPPYWQLRDYGAAGQIGQEPSLHEYLEKLLTVCAEIKRLLKPDGTFWLNIGDCYANVGKWGGNTGGLHTKALHGNSGVGRGKRDYGGLKSKDLCLIPQRLAIALQADGWWVRSEIIWAKPNPMPESVTDRPASAHEKIWLLTKSADSFYDYEAVRLPPAASTVRRLSQDIENQKGSDRAYAGQKPMKAVQRKDKPRGHSRRHAGFNERWDAMKKTDQQAEGRALRNYEAAALQVWEMATGNFSEAHFATFPPELVERCLKAGCPEGGTVLDPFGGSGTTGLVADRLQRHAVLIELNPEYAGMAKRRIHADSPLFAEITI
jgi:DNA modification methylase